MNLLSNVNDVGVPTHMPYVYVYEQPKENDEFLKILPNI